MNRRDVFRRLLPGIAITPAVAVGLIRVPFGVRDYEIDPLIRIRMTPVEIEKMVEWRRRWQSGALIQFPRDEYHLWVFDSGKQWRECRGCHGDHGMYTHSCYHPAAFLKAMSEPDMMPDGMHAEPVRDDALGRLAIPIMLFQECPADYGPHIHPRVEWV